MKVSRREIVVSVAILMVAVLAGSLLVAVLGQLARTSDALERMERRIATLPGTTAPTPGGAVAAIAPLYQRAILAHPPRWLGATLMQYPEDAWIIQDIIFETKPDVIVEAGTYRGGMALFMASVLSLCNPAGKVITVDISPEASIDREAREHPLWKRSVEFIQGDDVSPAIIERLKAKTANKKTLVMIDTLHSLEQTRKELRLYPDLVSAGSYLLMHDTSYGGYPPTKGRTTGVYRAVQELLQSDDRFQADHSREQYVLSLMPSGFLKRVR